MNSTSKDNQRYQRTMPQSRQGPPSLLKLDAVMDTTKQQDASYYQDNYGQLSDFHFAEDKTTHPLNNRDQFSEGFYQRENTNNSWSDRPYTNNTTTGSTNFTETEAQAFSYPSPFFTYQQPMYDPYASEELGHDSMSRMMSYPGYPPSSMYACPPGFNEHSYSGMAGISIEEGMGYHTTIPLGKRRSHSNCIIPDSMAIQSNLMEQEAMHANMLGMEMHSRAASIRDTSKKLLDK